MTIEEFKIKVKEILGDEWHIYFDNIENETTITMYGTCSQISLRELTALSELTNSKNIIFELEYGYEGDMNTNIIIHEFSISGE
jgi:hypothetical protein